MAEVYLARQSGLHGFQKTVVVKTIHDQLAESGEFVHMLLDEARIAARLKHGNVVDIYDLGQADDTYFIAMEYIPGKPLSGILWASKQSGELLDVYSVAHIVAEAADGLQAAHELKSPSGELMGLVHRDVSPGNIMITYEGGVKLVDFGVAKSMASVASTGQGQLKGKLGYHSPEQIKGLSVDARTDIFSLGVVLWESLTVGRLFRADSAAATLNMILNGDRRPPSEFRQGIPPELDQICLRALAVEPDDRFQTAAEMGDALREVLAAGHYTNGKKVIARYMAAHFADQRLTENELLQSVSRVEEAVAAQARDEQELSDPKSLPGGASFDAAAEPSKLGRYVALGIVIAAVLLIGIIVGQKGKDGAPATEPSAAPAAMIDAGGAAFIPPDAVAAIDGAVVAVVSEPDAAAVKVARRPDASVPDARSAVAKPPQPDRHNDREDELAKQREERAKRRQQAEAHYKNGLAKYRASDLIPAKNEFLAALELRPGYAPAFRGLGLVYERIGVKSKAVEYFRKYLKASPRAKDRDQIEARIKKLGG